MGIQMIYLKERLCSTMQMVKLNSDFIRRSKLQMRPDCEGVEGLGPVRDEFNFANQTV